MKFFSGSRVPVGRVRRFRLARPFTREATSMRSVNPQSMLRFYGTRREEDFAIVFRELEKVVYRTAMAQVASGTPGRRESAEDIALRVWHKVWKTACGRSWNPDRGSLGGWLTTVIRNERITYFRSPANRIGVVKNRSASADSSAGAADRPLRAVDREPTPLANLIAKEVREIETRVRTRLSEEQRQIWVQFYDHDSTYDQIAEATGFSRSTVWRRIQSILAELEGQFRMGGYAN